MGMKFGEARQGPESRRLWAAGPALAVLATVAGAVLALTLATSAVVLPLVLTSGLAVRFLARRRRPAPKASSRNLVIDGEYTVIQG